MKRKGLFETIALAVVTMMIIGVISVLGSKFVVDLGQIIRRETVPLAAARLSTTIIASANLEKANIQVDFDQRYNILEEDIDGDNTQEPLMSYSYNNKVGRAIIPSVEWFSSGSFDIKDSVSQADDRRFYCLKKTPSNYYLEAGKCKDG